MLCIMGTLGIVTISEKYFRESMIGHPVSLPLHDQCSITCLHITGGDVIVSCLQMFLICDMVKLCESLTRSWIIKHKQYTARICCLIFVQIALPLMCIFVFYSLSAYHLSKVSAILTF